MRPPTARCGSSGDRNFNLALGDYDTNLTGDEV